METLSIVLALTLAFALANLFEQLVAQSINRPDEALAAPTPLVAVKCPNLRSVDGMSRTRTDRHDLQTAMGHDFASPDVEESLWPRNRGDDLGIDAPA